MTATRAKTLVQVGAMLHKAGVLEHLGIKLGDDLKADRHLQKPTAILAGLTFELERILATASKEDLARWERIGTNVVGRHPAE